ncbi:MAG: sugar ABC transporter substrate-binding protein, partial [Planctomycetes bacterium]|nr:sugar ABC transporter substrate-binding protein [Planctomycetota bacterium]
MKKMFLGMLAVTLFLTAFAVAGEKNYVIGYANMADTDVFVMKRKESFEAEVANDANIRVIYSDANNDNNRQLDQIDNFIMQNVDLLFVVPVDFAGVSVGVRKANRANIPVICLGIAAEGGESTFIGSPNFEAGVQQGEFMREKLPQNAKVLYLSGSHGYSHTTERWEGFKSACLDKRPDITLLASQTGDYERDRGMKVTEDWIQSFPQFDAIIAANDQMALGAIQALKTAGRLQGVLISGVDGVDDALRAIKSGEMAQSILQNAPAQAKAAYDAMKKILAGEALPKEIIVPFESLTAANIAEYYKGEIPLQ